MRPRTFALMATLAITAAAPAQIRIQGIDILAAFEASEAVGISADGTSVIAFCDGPDLLPGTPNARIAAIWNQAQWIRSMGTLNGGLYSVPSAVSSDGTISAGTSWSNPLGGDEHAFRWTRSGGIQDLGVPFGGDASFATGLSADGSVVCGYVLAGADIIAFRWTSGTGAQQISAFGEAVAMSADGSVIVGRGGGPGGYKWTAATGAQPLPAPPAGWDVADPVAISADGLTIIGIAADAPEPTTTAAYRWTAGGGYQFLPHIDAQNPFSEAHGASPDGSIVFGFSADEAVVWTAAGVQTCEDFLAAHDIFIGLWTEVELRGIAADNRTIAGTAVNPQDEPEGWIVTLPVGCYVNCDNSTAAPMLNINDFVCFMQKFAAGDPYANCDESVTPPALNVNDFVCFMQKFAAGCP